eukprot:COSAG01_NODE_3393_length_6149_cov_24.742149_9_plen_72_part_00
MGGLPELVELQPAGVVAVVAPEELGPVLPPRHLPAHEINDTPCPPFTSHGASIILQQRHILIIHDQNRSGG